MTPEQRRRLLRVGAALLVAAALGVAARSRTRIVMVESISMLPTLHPGDILLVDRGNRLNPPYGAVVVVTAKDGRRLLKRAVAAAGDTVALSGGGLLVNGQPRTAAGSGTWPHLRSEWTTPHRKYVIIDAAATSGDEFGPYLVPSGTLFLLGDNRDFSLDSRLPPVLGGTGAVGRHQVVGTVVRVIASVDRSAVTASPLSWLEAVRWSRFGMRVQ